MSNVNNKTTKKRDRTKILPILSVIISLIAIIVSVYSNMISNQANQIAQTVRNESLDSRNIANYQRYEDLFWSNDPVKEARAVAFFRRDGNMGYKCNNLYMEFIEAQNCLNQNQKERLQKHLARIFEVANFDDIEKIKCK